MDDDMDGRLFTEKNEGFLAKEIIARVALRSSHGCSECGGASKLQWVLTASDILDTALLHVLWSSMAL